MKMTPSTGKKNFKILWNDLDGPMWKGPINLEEIFLKSLQCEGDQGPYYVKAVTLKNKGYFGDKTFSVKSGYKKHLSCVSRDFRDDYLALDK